MTEVVESDYQRHTANIYYVGKMGKLGIDFNGSYFNYRSGRDDEAVETSIELGSRNVHSDSRQHSQVYAAKLMFDYPLLGGKLSFGTEMSKASLMACFVIWSSTYPLLRRIFTSVIYPGLPSTPCR